MKEKSSKYILSVCDTRLILPSIYESKSFSSSIINNTFSGFDENYRNI
jgi:hypothetical protein